MSPANTVMLLLLLLCRFQASLFLACVPLSSMYTPCVCATLERLQTQHTCTHGRAPGERGGGGGVGSYRICFAIEGDTSFPTRILRTTELQSARRLLVRSRPETSLACARPSVNANGDLNASVLACEQVSFASASARHHIRTREHVSKDPLATLSELPGHGSVVWRSWSSADSPNALARIGRSALHIVRSGVPMGPVRRSKRYQFWEISPCCTHAGDEALLAPDFYT